SDTAPVNTFGGPSMSEARLTATTAIVTGAANGMGAQCSRLLAEAGWRKLLLTDLDAARLESVAAPLRSHGADVAVMTGDITDAAFPANLLRALGTHEIGAMIHAAGVAPQTTTPPRIFEINLDASLRLLPAVRSRIARGGAAVFFAS